MNSLRNKTRRFFTGHSGNAHRVNRSTMKELLSRMPTPWKNERLERLNRISVEMKQCELLNISHSDFLSFCLIWRASSTKQQILSKVRYLECFNKISDNDLLCIQRIDRFEKTLIESGLPLPKREEVSLLR